MGGWGAPTFGGVRCGDPPSPPCQTRDQSRCLRGSWSGTRVKAGPPDHQAPPWAGALGGTHLPPERGPGDGASNTLPRPLAQLGADASHMLPRLSPSRAVPNVRPCHSNA